MEERYEIRGKIGQGGLGAVYRAHDKILNREVAIKRILPEDSGHPESEAAMQLTKEAGALSALQHPHIVTIYDVGIDKDGPFVVMELLHGKTVDDVVEKAVFTWNDFREFAMQTQEALIAAQDLDLVHRDLKPSNIMLTWLPSGKFQVKIVDFGLAKFTPKPSLQTIDQKDSIFGSIFFMAPEQFERVELDARTDLYAMGCVYYYALTGVHPFNGETGPQVMCAHLDHRVFPLHEIRPDLPRWVSDWIMWHINRQPEHRPSKARESLALFLQNVQLGDQAPAAETPAPARKPILLTPGAPVPAVQQTPPPPLTSLLKTAPQPIMPPENFGRASVHTSAQPPISATEEFAPAPNAPAPAEVAAPPAAPTAEEPPPSPSPITDTPMSEELTPKPKPRLIIPGAKPVAAPTPVDATPVVATPVVATPVVATPVVATPVVATPLVATPVVATPVVATPVATIPAAAPEVPVSEPVEAPAETPVAVAITPPPPVIAAAISSPPPPPVVAAPPVVAPPLAVPVVPAKPALQAGASPVLAARPIATAQAAPGAPKTMPLQGAATAPGIQKPAATAPARTAQPTPGATQLSTTGPAKSKGMSNGAKAALATTLGIIVIVVAGLILSRSAQGKINKRYNALVELAALANTKELPVSAKDLDILLNAATSITASTSRETVYKALYISQSTDGTDVDEKLVQYTTTVNMNEEIRINLLRRVIGGRIATGRKDPKTATALIQFINSNPKPESAAAAIEALKGMANDEHFTPLLSLLQFSADSNIRKRCEEVVVAIIKQSTKRNSLADTVEPAYAAATVPEIKQSLLRVLGATGSPKAKELLLSNLKGSDKTMQIAAADASKNWPDESLLEPLIETISSMEDPTLRARIFHSCREFLLIESTRSEAKNEELWKLLAGAAKVDSEQEAVIRSLVTNSAANTTKWAVEIIRNFEKTSESDRVVDLAGKALDRLKANDEPDKDDKKKEE